MTACSFLHHVDDIDRADVRCFLVALKPLIVLEGPALPTLGAWFSAFQPALAVMGHAPVLRALDCAGLAANALSPLLFYLIRHD